MADDDDAAILDSLTRESKEYDKVRWDTPPIILPRTREKAPPKTPSFSLPY